MLCATHIVCPSGGLIRAVRLRPSLRDNLALHQHEGATGRCLVRSANALKESRYTEMQSADPRPDETQTLEALNSLRVLDSPPEAEFDALARAASLACGTPIALISLVDADRQWFKANVGLPGVTETARDVAFCAHAVLGDELFEVPDADQDARFADNPLVTGEPGVRFYAGAPVQLSSGHRVGTLCIIDRQPRRLTDTQREILRALASVAAQALEGRQASQLLRKSEDFLDRTGRVAGVGGWEVNIATGEITWSAETRRIHRVAPDFKPVMSEAINFYAPEARPLIQAAVERGMAAGEGWDLELPLVCADGQRIWTRAVGSVEFTDGKPVRLVGAFQDITERKALELKLAAASAEVLDLYDNAPCGYHSIDSTGTFLHINATAASWLGCKRDDLIGKRRMIEFFTPEGQEQFRQNFGKLIAIGRVEGLEFDLLPGTGAGRRVSVTATAVKDDAGAFLMSRTVMFDITELHRTREQLRQLNRELQAMLDNDLIGIVKVRDRRVLWANEGMSRLFGYSRSEWHDMSMRRLHIDEAAYERAGREAYAAMRHEGRFREQIQMRRNDGSLVWIDASGTLLSPEQGEALLLLMDVTPLKEAADARIRLIELESQNAQLQETGRLKDQFVSNMSHELRTPLNAVIGYAHLLQSGTIKPGSPKYLPYLTQIGASGKHLLQLIDSMLDFAKAQSGRIEFRPERTFVAHAINDVIDMLQDTCERKRVVATSVVSSDLIEAEVDPARLRQVLLSLLSNAIKFSNEYGRIDVRARLEGESHFRVEIEDHGIGIAEADLPRLFSHFYQLSSGNTKTHEGTGLGLALVRRMIEAQGGSVGAQSRLGEGSTFHFTLPLKASAARA